MGDFIESKVGVDAFKVDLVAFFRWLRRKPDPMEVGASRFLRIFQDHGIATSQIPRFFPQITWDKLRTSEALLPVLSDEVLEQTSSLFGVQRSWFEGVDECIYRPLRCYLQPARFFNELAQLSPNSAFPLHVLYSGKPPSTSIHRYQPLVLVLEDQLQVAGGEEICRYRVYGDGWDWNHDEARIQLKAMMRVVYEACRCPIPMFRVEKHVLKQVEAGKCVPRKYLQGCALTEPSFEDYVLSPENSLRAKECEELPEVLAYIEKHQMSLHERNPSLSGG